jgi:phosphoribosyl-ATP pyrophosphohydrolase
MAEFSLHDLATLIHQRSLSTADTSYTKSLLDAGINQISKKFGEESVELIIAALGQNRHAVLNEAADVLYHLLVLLQSTDVKLVDVIRELDRRTAQSGHQEKAGRSK